MVSLMQLILETRNQKLETLILNHDRDHWSLHRIELYSVH